MRKGSEMFKRRGGVSDSPPKRVILAGNPNCGKSTLYNALTGAHAKTGNWHGVTVGVSSRTADFSGVRAEVFDLPGIYSLDAYSMEEKISRREIEEGEYDLVVCVADAVTLPRSFALLKSILRRGKRVVLVVTMCDLLLRRGGLLDEKKLSARLRIPVLAISAHDGADIRKLKAFLKAALEQQTPPQNSGVSGIGKTDAQEFSAVQNSAAELLEGAYRAGKYRAGVFDKILYNKYIALPLFLLIMLAVFFLAFAEYMPGVLLKNACETLISEVIGEKIAAAVERTGAAVGAAFLRSIFSSVGMLLSFVPQIAILYLALFFLEESGYMSALAFMTDGLFRRVGLTGRAAFSVLMGFGCSAAAILTTRGLENKQLQKRVVFMLAYVSCSAKMPVYLAVISSFFAHPFFALTAVYAAGVLLSFGAALALKNVYKGGEEFVMEIAHPQIPSPRLLLKSLLFSLKQFIIKIGTVVTAFLIAMWVLLSFTFSFDYVGAGSENSILAILCRGIRFLFYPMGITQWQVALSAVSGLVAKESVAGMLSLFYGSDLTQAMSAPSAIAFILFIMTCSPCVSAIAAAAREFGWKRAFVNAAVQTALAFGISYAVYALLSFGAALAAVLSAALPLAALGFLIFNRIKVHEKIHRTKGAKPQRFHRRNVSAGFVCLFSPAPRPRYPRERR